MERLLDKFSTRYRLLLVLYLTGFAILFAFASHSAYSSPVQHSISVWVALLVVSMLFIALVIVVLVHIILNPNNNEI